MSESSRRQATVRFDQHTHDRLQNLCEQSGDSISELVRSLVIQALDHSTSVEILARTQAIAARIGALEQRLGHVLPALHERLGTLEHLVCGVDANAARRRELDHARHDYIWGSSRYGIWELQQLSFHLLEYTMASNGLGREVSAKFHADCQDVSDVGYRRFRTKAEQKFAEIETGSPAALKPSPAPTAESAADIAIRELRDLADAYRPSDSGGLAALSNVEGGLKTADRGPLAHVVDLGKDGTETQPDDEQPGLFDAAGNGKAPQPTDQHGARTTGGGTGPNRLGNGGGEVLP